MDFDVSILQFNVSIILYIYKMSVVLYTYIVPLAGGRANGKVCRHHAEKCPTLVQKGGEEKKTGCC